MNAWARRGLQAAFFTGGMLALGAGIASASECCPDRPVSPLSGSATVPVRVCDNVVGTPAGQLDAPCVEQEIGTDGLLDVVRVGAEPTGGLPAGLPADGLPTGLPADTVPLDGLPVGAMPVGGLEAADARGNQGHVHLVIPFDVSGNALALGGDAHAAGTTDMTVRRPHAVISDGGAGAFAGNVVAVDGVVPFAITGNAVSVAGESSANSNSTTEATAGGPIVTDGSHGPVSGNVLALPFAVPVQVGGNAVSVGGPASASGSQSVYAESGGDVETTGEDQLLSGNAGSAPVAFPLQVNGNAVAGAGRAYSDAFAVADAFAGGDVITNGDPAAGAGNVVSPAASGPASISGNAVSGAAYSDTAGAQQTTTDAGGERLTTGEGSLLSGNAATGGVAAPAQVLGNAVAGVGDADGSYDDATSSTASGLPATNGSDGAGSGNIAQPAVAAPAQIMGNAAAGVGNASSLSSTDTTATSGGFNSTDGDDSLVGGTIAEAPVSAPVQVFGNGAAAAGDVEADHVNTVAATTTSDSYTQGDGGLAGGTLASAPLAVPAEVFGNSAAGAGDADAVTGNDSTSQAGGFTGTSGDDSAAGGNLAQAPVAMPLQAMGNSAGALGEADSSVDNVKLAEAGGPPNTDDDNGLVASNAAHTPVSGPVEIFGNAAGGLADVDSHADSETSAVSGGMLSTSGEDSAASGNAATAALAMPAQVFGSTVTGLADGEGVATGETTSSAGGDVYSDGSGGVLTGNTAGAALSGPAQVFGDSVAAAGYADSAALNTTDADAGGAVYGSGNEGIGAGNIVQVPGFGMAQAFGSAVTGAGRGAGYGGGTTTSTAGGDLGTGGNSGLLSGNILTAPLGVVGHGFGVAATVLGVSDAAADNVATGTSGGDTVTSPSEGLSGLNIEVPVGAVAQAEEAAVNVLGATSTTVTDDSSFVIGGQDPLVELPAVTDQPLGVPGSAADDLPMLPNVGMVPDAPAMPELPDLTNLNRIGGLPDVASVPAMPEAPEGPDLAGFADLLTRLGAGSGDLLLTHPIGRSGPGADERARLDEATGPVAVPELSGHAVQAPAVDAVQVPSLDAPALDARALDALSPDAVPMLDTALVVKEVPDLVLSLVPNLDGLQLPAPELGDEFGYLWNDDLPGPAELPAVPDLTRFPVA